jgi:hypothetical protein
MARILNLLGVGLLSAGTLTFEIALTRLLAVQQFHHFAFLIVSLAIMGTAAGGLALALRRSLPDLSALAAACALSVIAAYATINLLPFDSYTIAWDRRQVASLGLYFLATALPFVFAGWAVGAALTSAGARAHLPYAASFLGAAAGCLTALSLPPIVGGEAALLAAAVYGLLAAASFAPRWPSRAACLAGGLLVLSGLRLLPAVFPLRLSPYKALSAALLMPDARHALTWWGPTSRLDVVESQSVHVMPGLSLNAGPSLPDQAALFVDGEGPIPITRLSTGSSEAQSLAGHMPATLGYTLRPAAQALVLQPGAGLDVALSLAAGAGHVSIPTDEPLLVRLLAGPYQEFTLGLAADPQVTLLEGGDRTSLRRARAAYDVVQISLSEGYRPVTSGAFSLTENYTLTVESFQDAWHALRPDGLLVITRWLGTPPSDEARAWATAAAMLRRQGISSPADHLIAYRGMRTATIVLSRRPFTSDELERARVFLEQNGFDPIHVPGLPPDRFNRFNRLPQDVYADLFQAILRDPPAALRGYEFNLRPPTDDRPYYHHFFRWRQTPEVLATLGRTWQPFGGSGYLVLIVLLILMLALALPMGFGPWLALRSRARRLPHPTATVGYFACLGAGYLLVEIPLIQRMTLLLERPALALATVLFTLLLTSGLGSLLSPRLALRRSLLALLAALTLLLIFLPAMVRAALAWSLAARLVLAFAALAPAGLLMGVPFASGLRRLEIAAPGLIPLGWAINGAASGLSGIIAMLVSLDLGLRFTLGLGAAAYLGAWATARGLPSLPVGVGAAQVNLPIKKASGMPADS